jgi:L-histidine Nalpha-methyltransferase / hercynylcysteine S-oxide synthase
LDLSLPELKRTFAELDTRVHNYVKFNALHGTYDDGLEWLQKLQNDGRSTCVLTLGSSLGNFTREGAAQFLSSFRKALKPSDLIIIGLDACQKPERVHKAYNDSEKVTEQFYRNGLEHANRILGREVFKQDEWRIEGIYDDREQKHQASYVTVKAINDKDFMFAKDEKVHLEDAFKYAEAQSDALWHQAGLLPQTSFSNKTHDHCEI